MPEYCGVGFLVPTSSKRNDNLGGKEEAEKRCVRPSEWPDAFGCFYAVCTPTGHIFVAFVHSRDNEKVLAEATICIRFVFFISIRQEERERGSLPIAIVYIVASVRQQSKYEFIATAAIQQQLCVSHPSPRPRPRYWVQMTNIQRSAHMWRVSSKKEYESRDRQKVQTVRWYAGEPIETLDI